MKASILLTVVAVALMVVPLSADEVTLHSGGKLLGIATEGEDVVTVETAYGKIEVPRDLVLSIDRTKRSDYEEYKDKVEETDMEEADEVYALAKWAKGKKLNKQAKDHFQKAIEIEPDHEFARRELGFKLFQGRWMTEEEIMLAKGFVRHGNKWLTPAERELIVKAELEKAHAEELRKREREEAKLARKEKKAEGRRERAPEVIYTMGRDPRRSMPGYFQYHGGGYGVPPGGGLVLTHDIESYYARIYNLNPSDFKTLWPYFIPK